MSFFKCFVVLAQRIVAASARQEQVDVVHHQDRAGACQTVSTLLRVCVVAFSFALLAASAEASSLTPAGTSLEQTAASKLVVEAKCKLVDGKLKCSKNDDDDDDHHKKGKNKGEKTAKLTRVPGTCSVIEAGTVGGGGGKTPAVRRCDKTKGGDQVCCCYQIAE